MLAEYCFFTALFECEGDSTYSDYATPCPDTCLLPTASADCDAELIPGCVCPDGMVLSGNTCVNRVDCGCPYTGADGSENYYPVGIHKLSGSFKYILYITQA